MVQAECFANTWYLCREYGDIQDLRSYISEYAIVAQLVKEDYLKICNKCHLQKNLDCFHRNRSKPDGYSGNCKDCQKTFDSSNYKNNPKKLKYLKERQKIIYNKQKDLVRRYKKYCGCLVCGEKEPMVLDLHHLDPNKKDANPSALYAKSRKRLKSEIRKCVVLCANCHRKVHAGLIIL